MNKPGEPGAAGPHPDDEHYLVRNRADILPILQALVTHRVAVRVQLDGRPAPVETRLLAVKPHYEELVFDAAGMSDLIFGDRASLHAEATYDYMHVRFDSAHVEAAVHHTRPAFRACIPAAITRSQRRGSIRFPVPSEHPPVVRLRLTPRGAELRMRVMDISLGGVCLVLEDRRADIAAGARLGGCKLELPGLGAVDTDLVVAYAEQIDPHSGWRRLGCRFSGLAVLALDRVRNYVAVLERQHLGAPK